MSITSKSTKAEILQAYERLQAQPTTWADAWALTVTTAQTVSRETALLIEDLQKGGRLAIQWIRLVIDTYRQPVLRSKP
jgi:hypothetical protein